MRERGRVTSPAPARRRVIPRALPGGTASALTLTLGCVTQWLVCRPQKTYLLHLEMTWNQLAQLLCWTILQRCNKYFDQTERWAEYNSMKSEMRANGRICLTGGPNTNALSSDDWADCVQLWMLGDCDHQGEETPTSDMRVPVEESAGGMGLSDMRTLYQGRNIIPPPGWLNQQKFINSQFWRREGQAQGVGRVGSSLGLWGRAFSVPFS